MFACARARATLGNSNLLLLPPLLLLLLRSRAHLRPPKRSPLLTCAHLSGPTLDGARATLSRRFVRAREVARAREIEQLIRSQHF